MLFLVYLINFLGFFMVSTMAKDSNDQLMTLSKLKMFVDELQDMPRIKGYDVINGVHVPKSLKIGMYKKKWVSNSLRIFIVKLFVANNLLVINRIRDRNLLFSYKIRSSLISICL